MENVPFNDWITCRAPQPDAAVRLFCFPYAGGGASVYRDWPRLLADNVEVCAIQLPGRENRLKEPLIRQLPALIEKLVVEIRPFLTRPFAFFGHSMGALLNYELTHALMAAGAPGPAHLFLSAYRAPHLPPQRQPIHRLPDKQFIAELRHLNGTPTEVLANQELLALVLPIVRNDFAMLETFIPQTHEVLETPISAFAGLKDPDISQADVQAWQQHTTAEFKLRMLPGDHFYLHTYQTLLCRAVERDLLNIMAQPRQTQPHD